jgi:hypothetical protein
LRFKRPRSRLFPVLLLIIIVSSAAFGFSVTSIDASPDSNYLFKFDVKREGFTAVEINFNSTDASGDSWVFVPKYSSWNHTESGQITQSSLVETDQVIGQSLYFYQAFRFHYTSSGIFNMTLRFDFDNGALIMEPRGIFYSPQIGFQENSHANAIVNFDPNFQINQDLAIIVGSTTNYPVQRIELNQALFAIPQQENVVRLQVEFSISAVLEETTLKSSDDTFTFKTPSRYNASARNVLRFYDQIYGQATRLFNVTLDNVEVQWFLPDFESLLSVGGYVPVFTGGLGEININVVFIRTVNGTIETIAAHELVHRFLGKAGIWPNDFLWFHEGMAQYISVNIVSDLGYEGAGTEINNLENGASSLIQQLGGENFGLISLQSWSPTSQPSNVDSLYLASYYVASRLPQVVGRDGFEYYQRFFELIGQLPSDFNGVKVKNISELALYLSQAANASVALTLKRWGFSLTDLYESPIQDLVEEAGKEVAQVNPVFQPYRFLADYLYQQALLSAEQSDWNRASSLLQLSIALARLAPLLTFLSILGVLALLVFVLTRRSRRPRPVVPPPPPEIMQA